MSPDRVARLAATIEAEEGTIAEIRGQLSDAVARRNQAALEWLRCTRGISLGAVVQNHAGAMFRVSKLTPSIWCDARGNMRLSFSAEGQKAKVGGGWHAKGQYLSIDDCQVIEPAPEPEP